MKTLTPVVTGSNGNTTTMHQRRWRKVMKNVLSKTCVIAIGGRASCLGKLVSILPEKNKEFLAIDSDLMLTTELDMLQNKIHLSSEGSISTILKKRCNYKYLDKDAVPPDATPWDTMGGVGMVRMVASILFGPYVQVIKLRIRQLLEECLGEFTGPEQKRLVVHLVFSISGGTGSALAIPIAMLVRGVARSISPTLKVEIVAHAVGPAPFYSLLSVPVEQVRDYANAGQTLRELFISQMPLKIQELALMLEMAPLECVLWNKICYYEGVASGDSVMDLSEIGDRIVSNVAAHENQALALAQAAREANPLVGQLGKALDEAGTTIIACCFSAMARVPATKLAKAVAVREQLSFLHRWLAPTESQKVQSLLGSHLPSLQMDQTLATTLKTLQPDSNCYMRSLDKLDDQQVLAECERAEDVWATNGRPELADKQDDLAYDSNRHMPKIIHDFLSQVSAQFSSLQDYRSLLSRTIQETKNRNRSTCNKIEKISRADAAGIYRQAKNRFRNQQVGWLTRSRDKKQLRAAFNNMVDDEVKQATLRVFSQKFICPMMETLESELTNTSAVEQTLSVQRRQLERERAEFEQSIGFEDDLYTEVILPEEVDSVLSQISKELSARQTPRNDLTLPTLLRAQGGDNLLELLKDIGRDLRERLHEFLSEFDLNSFVQHFQLNFDVENWLTSLDITLPAKLNRFVYGPAQAPLRAYVVAARSMRSCCMELIVQRNDGMDFEFVANEDPLALIVRAEVSRAPFSSINTEEIDRYYRLFLKERAAKKSLYDYLESVRLFEKAKDIRFMCDDGTAKEERHE